MDNRQLIMEKALELFCARGYDAVGVQEIAEQSGITKPTLYYYFGSKQGLMETILEENSRILEEMLEKVADYYDDEVEAATQAVTAVMEPLIIILMAAIVVPIMGAIMAPMLSIYSMAENS